MSLDIIIDISSFNLCNTYICVFPFFFYRHHTMGNTERGHFHETLEAYTAENKYMSDIVKYFVRPSSLRPDVIQFIKRYHTDCPVCNALYLQINRNMSMSQSTQDIRKISTTHHENNS